VIRQVHLWQHRRRAATGLSGELFLFLVWRGIDPAL